MSVTNDGGLTWNQLDLPFTVREASFFDINHGWVMDETNLVHYTSDAMQSFRVSNCGKEILNRIIPISPDKAFAIAGTPGGESFRGKAKTTFDENNIVNCNIDDRDGDGFLAPEDCNDQSAQV